MGKWVSSTDLGDDFSKIDNVIHSCRTVDLETTSVSSFKQKVMLRESDSISRKISIYMYIQSTPTMCIPK